MRYWRVEMYNDLVSITSLARAEPKPVSTLCILYHLPVLTGILQRNEGGSVFQMIVVGPARLPPHLDLKWHWPTYGQLLCWKVKTSRGMWYW